MEIRKSLLIVLSCAVVLCTGCKDSAKDPVQEASPAQKAYQESLEATVKFEPDFTSQSNPENWKISWECIHEESEDKSFKRDKSIDFGPAEDYTKVKGVTTFRGNNYRNDPTYGEAYISDESLEIIWDNPIGSLGEWSGCGWSGQPMIVQWDEQTRKIMNIYPKKKSKKNLTEVIYATMDGNIYFFDLEDGSPTRDRLKVGMTFKGTGALDPRGYPIMYIGSGIAGNSKDQRMYAINLIDTTVIYEQSGNDSSAFRYWPAFDSSPLIDAKTDTLIWPGENGVLYTIKLNTKYNPKNKTISIDPENVAKARYRVGDPKKGGRWLGFEGSCVIVGRYLYIGENGGMFFCVNLDTMELVWTQDTLDDTNSSPVFDWGDDKNGYIYTAPSLRWTASGEKGTTTIFRLNAQNGEIEWDETYKCARHGDTSGGVQSTPVLGRKGSDLENLIIYNIAFSPSGYEGELIAFDKETGDVAWQYHMDNYTWSSPVAVYTKDNKGYILICDSLGNVKLINGSDGEFIDSVNIGSNVEASPAVFEDTLVVGTRGCKIYGIKIY